MTPGKTLAIRLLEQRRIVFQEIRFPDSIHDALGVAAFASLDPADVYKTLVAVAEGARHPALFVIPGDRSLDLKAAARALGVKRAEMASHTQAESLTGLKVGGISALALTHRPWPVFLDRAAESRQTIVVSAGERGLNVRLAVGDFVSVTGARWIESPRVASVEG